MNLKIDLSPIPGKPGSTEGPGSTGVSTCARCGQPMCTTDGRGPGMVPGKAFYRTTLCANCNRALFAG